MNKKPVRPATAAAAPAFPVSLSQLMMLLLGSFILAWIAYSPALHGPFLFDDLYLPPGRADVDRMPLRDWLGGRPLLGLSFWLTYQTSGIEPFAYHLFNLLLHFANAVLTGLIVRKIVAWTGVDGRWQTLLGGVCGALFLFHPAQTEAVAYVASRSEVQSAFFYLAAFTAFLYRRAETITWTRAGLVLLLFVGAAASKEHTVTLPALLLLTDWFFGQGSFVQRVKQHARLYVPVVIGAVLGGAFVLRTLAAAPTAGFKVQDFTWQQYFFTQWRVICYYIRLFLWPVGLNADYDFAVSRTVADHNAWLAGAVLLLLAVAAVVFRKRAPLAAYGYLAFLLMLAPTSSVVPIQDVIVERRLYLPFLGLMFVLAEGLRCLPVRQSRVVAVATALLLVLWYGTYQRNAVWGDKLAFWSDTADKSPGKQRARFQLAYARWEAKQCAAAVEDYAKAAAVGKVTYNLLADWALALECNHQPKEAMEKLRQAAALERNSHVYALMGMIYGKQGQREEAMSVLQTALEINPGDDAALLYRGNVYAERGEYAKAYQDYQQAATLNPSNDMAQRAVARMKNAFRR